MIEWLQLTAFDIWSGLSFANMKYKLITKNKLKMVRTGPALTAMMM